MKTQKIVLALALAVTPVVLVAQENDNAYNNQNHKEVIVAQNPRQEASFFGSEGKMLNVSELTLQKIRAHRAARKKAKAQTPRVANVTPENPHNAYYVYGGREGHMMALGNLGKREIKKDTVREEARDTIPTYIHDADTISRNHQTVLIGDSNSVKKSIKQRNNAFRYYVKIVTETLAQDAPYEK